MGEDYDDLLERVDTWRDRREDERHEREPRPSDGIWRIETLSAVFCVKIEDGMVTGSISSYGHWAVGLRFDELRRRCNDMHLVMA